MTNCRRCNKFMLFNSQTGYCKACYMAVKSEQQRKKREESEKLRREEELRKKIDATYRDKKEKALQSMTEEDKQRQEYIARELLDAMYKAHPELLEKEPPKKKSPEPKPIDFTPGNCEFPYGDNREYFKDTVDVYLSTEEKRRLYKYADGDFLEYADPLKDIYEKVLNELAENLASGYRQLGQIWSIRKQYAKDDNESDESVAVRILLSKHLVIGVPYEFKKNGRPIPMG
ncbi:MAG: hypothetical protein IKQ45_00755 [Clostridia bacterium]|nr:hypothetical protein [Clostridia bacterium]